MAACRLACKRFGVMRRGVAVAAHTELEESMHGVRYLFALVLACIGCAIGMTAARAEYPDHPIRIVILFPPGGETDPLARAVGQELGKTLHTSVVIENRPGAAGNIAGALVAHSPKDGYTLLWGLGTQLTVNPILYKDLSYSVEKDLTPISMMAESGFVLVVNPKVPAHSLQELVQYAKEHPGKLNVSTAGVGSPLYLANMLFMACTGTQTVNITYAGNTALPVRQPVELDWLYQGQFTQTTGGDEYATPRTITGCTDNEGSGRAELRDDHMARVARTRRHAQGSRRHTARCTGQGSRRSRCAWLRGLPGDHIGDQHAGSTGPAHSRRFEHVEQNPP
jgi:hypothetical protein